MKRYSQNLWTYLKQQSCNFGLLERIELAIKVVKEVETVHKLNIVHRDIKPSNIMLDESKQPVLVDFGIAKWKSELVDAEGTPGFVAPEVFQGFGRLLDHPAVDTFALGKLLVLILFEWELGWQILWSSKKYIESKKLKHFTDLLSMIRLMLRVIYLKSKFNNKNYYLLNCFLKFVLGNQNFMFFSG